MKDQKGFTLIEMMIALFILCFALLVMGVQAGAALKGHSGNRLLTTATTLMQSKAEELKNRNFNLVATGADAPRTINGVSFTPSWTVTQNGNLKVVDLTVTWMGKSVTGRTVVAE